ncbi:M28 family peptidase [bacterium]|nr:M28 family peptidase [bacterium]
MARGWSLLLEEAEAARGRACPIAAYSELMPAPHVGVKPTGDVDPFVRGEGDLAWRVSEQEERRELEPALSKIATHVIAELLKLAQGTSHHLSHSFMRENPAWPRNLAEHAAKLEHEAHVIALPLALSRTQDDKGRVRWTLFGSSHDGPARPFWRSFEGEKCAEDFLRFLAFGQGAPVASIEEARRAGARVLPIGDDPDFPAWADEPIPDFARALVLQPSEPRDAVRALVTFRPFERLPLELQRSYLERKLRLLPCPESLVFWNGRSYGELARELPLATHVPLLQLFHHCENAYHVRIPQSGWLAEKNHEHAGPAAPGPRPLRRIERTHRWQRVLLDAERHELPQEDESAHTHAVTALFSCSPDDLGLYGKPMARNAQVWTDKHRALLDGPRASREELERAKATVLRGGHFGFRFFFPPMQAGERSVFWHRPLVAKLSPSGVVLLERAPLGYLSAERAGAEPIVFRPVIEDRPLWREAATIFDRDPGQRRFTTASNVRKLLEWRELLGSPLLPSFARRLLTIPKEEKLGRWLARLPHHSSDPERARAVSKDLRRLVRPGEGLGFHRGVPRSLTFHETATRAFEESYWKTIAALSCGDFREKDNADSIRVNQGRTGGARGAGRSPAPARDLDRLSDFLRRHYEETIGAHGMSDRAVAAYHVFRWETGWEFPWSQGWARNQSGEASERNVFCVIPGRNRAEAIIMGDHYDTAYMEDLYEPSRGGDRLRASAQGADDNHSATAALMLAAPILLELSKKGALARDVWLVHLTGEEFPADCLGARALAQRLLERNLALAGKDGRSIDLSRSRVRGAFVLDMIAHDNDRDRNVFQIAPGEGRGSARLALRAHVANERWNRSVPVWNRAPERRGRHGRRVPDASATPEVAQHPRLRGEVRPRWHPRSSIYNTDGVIFSDVGIPVVLFMENYDISREGYHDTKDTMAMIDLDYGAALAAIAIEAVADCACAEEI